MTGLAESIRGALAAAADPERAPGQQAYMKSAMPFYGVPLPEVRRLTKAAATGMTDAAALRATAIELWDKASRREERYAAMHLLGQRPLRADPEIIPIVEHMVRTGRWWDITDELAHRMAEALEARPDETAELVRRWSVDPDFWIRRIAILSQLGRRDRVDPRPAGSRHRAESGRSPSSSSARRSAGRCASTREWRPSWVRAYVAARTLEPAEQARGAQAPRRRRLAVSVELGRGCFGKTSMMRMAAEEDVGVPVARDDVERWRPGWCRSR